MVVTLGADVDVGIILAGESVRRDDEEIVGGGVRVEKLVGVNGAQQIVGHDGIVHKVGEHPVQDVGVDILLMRIMADGAGDADRARFAAAGQRPVLASNASRTLPEWQPPQLGNVYGRAVAAGEICLKFRQDGLMRRGVPFFEVRSVISEGRRRNILGVVTTAADRGGKFNTRHRGGVVRVCRMDRRPGRDSFHIERRKFRGLGQTDKSGQLNAPTVWQGKQEALVWPHGQETKERVGERQRPCAP